MALDLDGLVQMMRAILCDYHFELDPYIPPIPFRDEVRQTWGDFLKLRLDHINAQVSGTAGPMARDLDGLVQMMRAILCDYHFELDPYIPPIPFRDEIFESKRQLRVGFYVNDGYIPVVPACGRAVMMAKRALEQQGHTVCL